MPRKVTGIGLNEFVKKTGMEIMKATAQPGVQVDFEIFVGREGTLVDSRTDYASCLRFSLTFSHAWLKAQEFMQGENQ